MTDTTYWIWLAERLGIGSRHLVYLLDRFATPFDIFRAEPEEIYPLTLPEAVKDALCDKDMRRVQEIEDMCAREEIGVLTYGQQAYPASLRSLKDPPTVLYYKGILPDWNDTLSFAMVGTRKMSEYGKRSAYKIAYELAAAGLTIVSGMALGIDAVSACGAICGGGTTVAVLGCGVDVIYPKPHYRLYQQILLHGAVLSEYPPMTEPAPGHFPERNRLISGLSAGTFVVECDLHSGAMITARHTLEQGHDLFALPGNVGAKNTGGTNRLLRDGANLALEADDILKVYEFYYGNRMDYTRLSYAKLHSDLDEETLIRMGVCESQEAAGQEPDVNRALPKLRAHSTGQKKGLRPGRKKQDIPDDAPAPAAHRADTEAVLGSLTEKQRQIFMAMPDDRAVNLDTLMRGGFTCADVMGALAVLEIKGLVSSLPGGLYLKA